MGKDTGFTGSRKIYIILLETCVVNLSRLLEPTLNSLRASFDRDVPVVEDSDDI